MQNNQIKDVEELRVQASRNDINTFNNVLDSSSKIVFNSLLSQDIVFIGYQRGGSKNDPYLMKDVINGRRL